MSYGLYIGRNHTSSGHAWLAGYGDEPSSHWLEIVPHKTHPDDAVISVGVTEKADLPGRLSEIPQAAQTARHIRVSYSYYKGIPAPITNGGLNEYGVAVRDIWSPSRDELIAMTPKDQGGPNYSDLARMVIERAETARQGVEIIAALIDQYGESSYGGNSHIIADPEEAWVMIQFAGGQGLWAAERLGPESIRASRPGYIGVIPIDKPDHPDFLYSDNLVGFAKAQGWYEAGPFDVNAILGDGNGHWRGARWVEGEMAKRAKRVQKIGFEDIVWAIRTPELTGDTAGYGQVVPLTNPSHDQLRLLWHAPIGAIAAPLSPVFIGQDDIPPEFARHRYLSAGEAHRVMDDRWLIAGEPDAVSLVDQRIEASRSAVAECKRLFYLMLQDKTRFTPEVMEAFHAREARLAEQTKKITDIAEILLDQGETELAANLLGYFSNSELRDGLELVQGLATGIEARQRALGISGAFLQKYDQIW